MSARSRSSPWFRAPRTEQDVMEAADAAEPPRAAFVPPDYLTHDLEPHCDNPECCVGTIIARCRRCGFVATVNGRCPATEDVQFDKLLITMGPAVIVDCRSPSHSWSDP